MLGRPRATIAVVLHRARKRLQVELQELMEQVPGAMEIES
jgi:hypothetical protein